METIDKILNYLQEEVKQNRPISPTDWVTAAERMNILKSDETNKLYELQQDVAKLKVTFMEEGDSVAKAKVKVEASDLYKDMCKQRARIELIEEQIRIAKIHAKMVDNEMKGY